MFEAVEVSLMKALSRLNESLGLILANHFVAEGTNR